MNTETLNRNKVIIRTSIIGIITNVFLVIFKAGVGFFSNSIAVILDAVNNLSDALSSVITIIGTKLAGKSPDKKHPLGYGRIEYLSSMIVSAIVLYAGITSFVESVKKIISPEQANYNAVSLIIISVAVIVKLVLGGYVKKQGNKVNSGALTASGSDALFDAVISASVLLSAIIYLLSGISLEAYVGVIIALVIIKAGIEMLNETLDDILGKRADGQTVKEVKRIINEEKSVLGAYDLILYNYGPERNYGSVHIELPDTLTVGEVDVLTRQIEKKVYLETGIILTGIGVYAYNIGDDEIVKIRNTVQNKVLSYDWALQMHGFYVDTAAKHLRFDVVVSFDISHNEAITILHREIQQLYPEYNIEIVGDVDVSESMAE